MSLLDEIMNTVKKADRDTIPGKELFKLYDTYGFPLDLAREMAIDNHLLLDEESFHREMEIQRERARASWVGEEQAIASIYRELNSEIGKTLFVGYDLLESESMIKAIIKDGKVIKEADSGETVELILDKTPFYGESGGQVGDAGIIYNSTTETDLINTKKEAGINVHVVKIKGGCLHVWDT